MEPVKKNNRFYNTIFKTIYISNYFLRFFSGDKSNQHDTGRLIPIKPGAVKEVIIIAFKIQFA